jgi:hypothetical protein
VLLACSCRGSRLAPCRRGAEQRTIVGWDAGSAGILVISDKITRTSPSAMTRLSARGRGTDYNTGTAEPGAGRRRTRAPRPDLGPFPGSAWRADVAIEASCLALGNCVSRAGADAVRFSR